MIFACALVSALAVAASVHGRAAVEVTYAESEEQTRGEQTEMHVGVVVGDGGGGGGGGVFGDDRSANLRYVMAIRNSSIWADVRVRSLTVRNVDPRTSDIVDAAPDGLSNDELAALRRVCHDGLKCVAVDQLLVLRSTEEMTVVAPPSLDGPSAYPAPGGGGHCATVRRAITKITRVLTNYTDEYHEESEYQYEEVTESDDASKVRRSVTTILKDNAELCGPVDDAGQDAAAGASGRPAAAGAPGRPAADAGQGADAGPGEAPLLVNNGLANFGTVNNYNINTGNINSASVTTKGPVAVIDPTGSETPSGPPSKSDRATQTADCGCAACSSGPDAAAASAPGGRSSRAPRGHEHAGGDARRPEAAANVDRSAGRDAGPRPNGGGGGDDGGSYVMLGNGGRGAGQTGVDVVSVGEANNDAVLKGYAEDGVVNNGDMQYYDVNNGTRNKGVVRESDAASGIINVGTLNYGPTNYGTVNHEENRGTTAELNSASVQQYAANIDKMYSTVLANLANN